MDAYQEKLITLINDVELIIEELRQTLLSFKEVDSQRHVISFILMRIKHYNHMKDPLTDEKNFEKRIQGITEIFSATKRLTNDISDGSDVDAYIDSKLFDQISAISQKVSNLFLSD